MKNVTANIPPTLPIGRLDLSSTGITQIPPGLANLTNISELKLGSNDLEIIRTGELAINSTSLIFLHLSDNNKLRTIEKNSLPSKSTNNQHCMRLIHFKLIILIPYLSCLFSFFWRASSSNIVSEHG